MIPKSAGSRLLTLMLSRANTYVSAVTLPTKYGLRPSGRTVCAAGAPQQVEFGVRHGLPVVLAPRALPVHDGPEQRGRRRLCGLERHRDCIALGLQLREAREPVRRRRLDQVLGGTPQRHEHMVIVGAHRRASTRRVGPDGDAPALSVPRERPALGVVAGGRQCRVPDPLTAECEADESFVRPGSPGLGGHRFVAVRGGSSRAARYCKRCADEPGGRRDEASSCECGGKLHGDPAYATPPVGSVRSRTRYGSTATFAHSARASRIIRSDSCQRSDNS